MGESTEELNQDIEETRARLGAHVDELQDKVSPSAIAGRRKDAAVLRVASLRDKALGSAQSVGQGAPSPSDAVGSAREQLRGAPIAAGVAAFGLGMVLSALIPSSRAEQAAAAQLKDVAQEQAKPIVDDAKAAATDVGQRLKETAAGAVADVQDAGADAAAKVQEEVR